jgi:hypothetical protein
MPQLSSTDRLIMATNDMSNALQHPHPELPFTHVGYDTISALTALAEISKLKFEKVHIPTIPAPPAQITQRTYTAKSSNPILTSPVPPPRQKRSQITIETRHYFRGSSHHCRVSLHLRGCQDAQKILPPQLVSRRLLRHGHCPHGHRP